MMDSEVKQEVLNSFNFSKVVSHLLEEGISADVREELTKAEDCIDKALQKIDGSGMYEALESGYKCRCERERGRIVSLVLIYSKEVSSYMYCE